MMMKSAQTAKIGKKFQAAREALGLSEEDASSKTLININFIRAIESGDYSAFPARMFALRYFQKYATFLKVRQKFFDIYDESIVSDNLNPKLSDSVIEILKNNRFNLIALIAMLFFLGIAGNVLYYFFPSSQAENPALLAVDILDNQLTEISELDKISISIAMKEINLLEKLEINAVEEEIFSEFQVKTGELTLLSLSFTQDSWIEIYQGTKQLIYRLFKVDETLEISIKPPFKIIAGNANGVSGFYGASRINFTKVANKLNVSFIEIDNE